MLKFTVSTWFHTQVSVLPIIGRRDFLRVSSLPRHLVMMGEENPGIKKYVLLYFLKDLPVLVADQGEKSQPRHYLPCDAAKSRTHC